MIYCFKEWVLLTVEMLCYSRFFTLVMFIIQSLSSTTEIHSLLYNLKRIKEHFEYFGICCSLPAGQREAWYRQSPNLAFVSDILILNAPYLFLLRGINYSIKRLLQNIALAFIPEIRFFWHIAHLETFRQINTSKTAKAVDGTCLFVRRILREI